MFESMLMAPSDPILDLLKIYQSDDRKNKINLSIGVYVDKVNEAPILDSVKHAEELLLKKEISKNYLSIEGLNTFNQVTQQLLFGKNESIISQDRVRTVQSPGGTGALRIIAECISKNTDNFKKNKRKKIWISNPTWINHKNIFLSAGLDVHVYPYYNLSTHSVDFDNMINILNSIEAGDIVLLHCCCHNPTGMDLNIEQWEILSECAYQKKWIPLFDLAYQGFDHDLKSDLKGVHIFCKKNPEIIICNSYSKNFGLYNERVGACTIIAENKNHADCTLSQLRSVIRANYSNPPYHGAAIVSTILTNSVLRTIWEDELKCMRDHIKNMRFLLIEHLCCFDNTQLNQDFSFIKKQTGMFAYMGLNENQVMRLREQYGIYLVESGRLNLAGLSEDNISYVSNAIQSLFLKTNKKISISS